MAADVTVPADLEAFVATARDRWGHIDGLVNNAGASAAGRLEDSDDDAWRRDIDLKLMAALRAVRLVLPSLRQSGCASVVNTLSIAAKAPPGASEPSSVTRAAGLALTKALANELGPEGVRVNAVLVGLIESGQWERVAARRGDWVRPAPTALSHSCQPGGPAPTTLAGVHDDTERCVRAVRSRDARFDGWFYTAVTTTHIYCRPSCPAGPPRSEHMRFFPSAAAAQHAGFRACKRCRPDASPGSPEWDQRADVAARAMRLVADGVVDRSGVAGLARQVGYSVRQLERLMVNELGAAPLALARAQRAQSARLLIETTRLPMAEVAFGAGFSSVRSFNDTVRAVFATSPTALRRRARPGAPVAAGSIDLRLAHRLPLHPDNLFGHLAATAVAGVEEWREGAYWRTLRLPGGPGMVRLAPAAGHVGCRLTLTDLRDLAAAISRCRRLLDLDADPVAIDDVLGADPLLAEAVARAPGRRVPRTVDPAELAVRAVLGQQVSTAAARTHAARLVAAHGRPLAAPVGGLTHTFPDPVDLAGLDPSTLALPRTRAATVVRMVEALGDGSVDLGAGADRSRARASLAALPGVGPWTVETIAMRALGDPDAFLPTDLGVVAAASRLGLAPGALGRHAGAAWRPWRSYAVQHLWGLGDHPVNRIPA